MASNLGLALFTVDAKVLGAVSTQMASEDLRSQEEMPRD